MFAYTQSSFAIAVNFVCFWSPAFYSKVSEEKSVSDTSVNANAVFITRLGESVICAYWEIQVRNPRTRVRVNVKIKRDSVVCVTNKKHQGKYNYFNQMQGRISKRTVFIRFLCPQFCKIKMKKKMCVLADSYLGILILESATTNAIKHNK